MSIIVLVSRNRTLCCWLGLDLVVSSDFGVVEVVDIPMLCLLLELQSLERGGFSDGDADVDLPLRGKSTMRSLPGLVAGLLLELLPELKLTFILTSVRINSYLKL